MTEIQTGQVWVCSAIDGTPPLLCIVGKLDPPPSGSRESRIVSLTVTPHPKTNKDEWPTVWHVPIYEEAFWASSWSLAREGVAVTRAFQQSYARWMSVFPEQDPTAFSASVSEAYIAVASIARDRKPLY